MLEKAEDDRSNCYIWRTIRFESLHNDIFNQMIVKRGFHYGT
jgi:hypothetical protein